MKQKVFTLLTLLVLCVTGAWADDAISCSAYLSGTEGTPTTTDCTLAYYSSEGSAGTIPAGTQVGTTSYYKEKINGDANYYVVTLNKKVGVKTYTKFIAGDVITVYLNANSSTQAYKVGKTAQTAVSASNSKNTNAVYGVDHALTAAEIETDGSLRIYRNSSNTHFAGISVAGTRSLKTPVTLSFASASGSFDVNAASPVLPAVSSDPDVTAVTDNIAYSSSNSAVATVNSSTGALTLVGIGTTTITASFAGDATYQEAEAEYTLTVTDATKLGYAEVLNPDNKTLADRWLFGMSHASVTQTFADYYSDGAIVDDGTNVSTLYLNGEAAANQYTNTKSWRKTQNGFIVDGKEQWVGYDIEIDENYLLNLTHLDARILIADNTYTWYVEILDKNGIQVYKSANQTTTKASTANLSTDIAITNLTGTVSVKLWVTQGGSSKRFSIEKLILTGTTAEDTRASYTITYDKGDGTGIVPDAASVREGDGYKTIKPYFLTKSGETFTGWKNAEDIYAAGDVFVPTGNMTLTAQFETNAASLSASTAETTVLWDFQKKNIGSFNLASGTLVTQATVGGKTIDLPLSFDNQVRNDGWQDWAIFNSAVTMTIPAIKGMQITMLTYASPSTMTIAGATDYTVTGSSNPYTVTYTYTGTDETIDICPIDASYIRTIQVVYPKTLAANPTITKGDFSFSTKSYSVTVTAEDGDALYVSTDGSSYSVQTSPYETTVAAGATCYAKTSIDGGTTYSDVVTCTNELDPAKSYVAWVYESNYANAPSNYNVANDEIYKALNAVYNVVLVDIKDYKSSITDEQKTALNGNLDDADLVVISEAAAGGSKAVIGLKDIIGTVPMLNMKFFAYTYNSTPSSNRWGWGTPKNADKAVVAMTPASKFYKVLNGVTFDGDNVALFAYPNNQNHIQYVDSWTAEPSGDVVLATITVSSVAKPVMHASTSQKYFALGLSCDDFTKYNSNAIAVVKNAAAMLIAGEALNTEMTTVTATVGANGYTTFASSYPLDLTDANRPAGLKAYKATRDGANLTFTALNQTVPAGTGLLLLGETKGGNYDIPVAASGDAVSSNALVGVIAPTAKQSDPSGNYYFVMKKAASESDALAFAPLSTSAAVTIPAGKAYVEVPNSAFSGGANELTISFEEDGDVTGISEMKAMRNVGRETFFDLQGRQVTQPMKGLYIVNGRKVVIK